MIKQNNLSITSYRSLASMLYGKEGIWYDTLASLAKLKNTSPKDQGIAANWQNLLSSVGLEEVATAEFVE